MNKRLFPKSGNVSHSVFTSWLASYCVLLFIPLLVSFIIYTQGKNSLETETYKVNGAILKQMQIGMDNAFNDVNLLVYKTGLNSKLLQFISKSVDRENIDRALLQDVLKYIADYKVDNAYAEDVYVYVQGLGMVLSTNGLKDAAAYYDYVYGSNPVYEALPFEQWQTLMKGISAGEYIMVPRKLEGGDTGQTLLYRQSIPFNDSRRSTAMIVVKLNEKKIGELMSGVNAFTGGAGMILGSDGKVIFHAGSPAWSKAGIQYSELKGDSGNLQAAGANGQRLAVTYTRSRYYGMEYVMVVPYSVFWSKVESIKALALGSMAVCILLGGLLAYLFARRNYNPVNALLGMLERRAPLLRTGRLNEYKLIEAAVDRALDENETIHNELRQHAAALRAVFLNKLIKGRIHDREVLEKGLATYGIVFGGNRFAVMLFLVREFREQGGEPVRPDASQDGIAEVYRIVGDILGETADPGISRCLVETDDMLCCIASYPDGPQDMKPGFNRAALEIESMVRSRGILLTVSVSAAHGSLYGIPEAYQEALNVMDYKLTTENGAVAAYEEINMSTGDYGYTAETEQRLINAVKSGNTLAAQAVLDGVFETSFSARAPSLDVMKCMLFDIAATMLKTLPEVGSVRNTSFVRDIGIANRLLCCETVNEMKNQMSLILRQVCEHIRSNRKTKKDELIESIVEYVNANYGSMNLNVSTLADRFDLTPAYLTHLFRETTTESLFDFIFRIRMERAKELLKDERCNIMDVARKVGYLNSAIFIRAFKKYQGVTPGMYREIG